MEKGIKGKMYEGSGIKGIVKWVNETRKEVREKKGEGIMATKSNLQTLSNLVLSNNCKEVGFEIFY